MMKTLVLAALLAAAAAGAAPAVAAGPPDFSGTWTLDRSRSTGLPPMYDAVRAQRLSVTQTASMMVVDIEIDAGAAEPERFHFEYALDGAETTTTTRVRTPNGALEVPTRLRARAGDDGRLHITITRELPRRGQTVTVTGTEEWELSADGRTLTVHRVEQTRQGAETRFDMVFARS
jgi:hypothetical protein